jgi:chloramphenicol-sensitive protein RarD
MTTSASGGETRLALTAGISCYLMWGVIPLVFQTLGHLGVSSWEILANRTVWAVPAALAFVLAARQGPRSWRCCAIGGPWAGWGSRPC